MSIRQFITKILGGKKGEDKRRLGIELIAKELNNFTCEDLERIVKFLKIAKTSKFVDLLSEENLKKIADIAEIVEAIEEKEASTIFEFITKAPKRKLEKIAILAGIARSIPELEDIRIPSEGGVKFDKYIEYIRYREIQRRLKDIEELSKKRRTLHSEKIKKLRDEIEKMGLFAGIARIAAEVDQFGPGDKPLKPNEKALKAGERALQPGERGLRSGESTHEGERLLVGEEGETSTLLTHDEIQRISVEREVRGEEREISEEIKNLFSEGVRFLKDRMNRRAYDIFNEIISRNNNLKGVWLNKGVAAGRLGKKQEEIDCYKRALEIDSDYEQAYINLQIT
jgi:tetratricopeptide (TPR) repeat protein